MVKVASSAALAGERDAAFEHRHRPDLDGIRGLLAVCVMMLHFGINRLLSAATSAAWQGFVFDLCVDVFFLLSGFVLASSYRASRDRGVARFAVKRFFRLVPVFYATTLLVLPSAATIYPFEYMPAEIVMGVPFAGVLPANYPAWSITWEFYLPLAAFFAAPFIRLPDRAVPVMLLACLIALAAADVQIAAGERFYAARAPLGLLAGALLCHLHARRHERMAAMPSSPGLTYALFAALVVLMGWAPGVPLLGGLVPPVAALLICSAAGTPSPLFSSRPLQWLGALSYTLYMAHIPVLQTLKTFFGEGVAANPAAMLAGVGASFLLAIALTRLVELPGIRLGAFILRALERPAAARRA